MYLKLERPPFPKAFDSSTRTSLSSCGLKGAYSGLHHLKPKRESNHLVAGSCFAHGIEIARKVYYTETPVDSGTSYAFFPDLPPAERAEIAAAIGAVASFLAKPEETAEEALGFKSAERLYWAVLHYFNEFPLERDPIRPYINVRGEPAVEYKFAIPTHVQHPETGEPILFTGKFDMLSCYDGQYWPVDEKTASRLGPTWSSTFDLRGQFLGYTWAIREQGYDCPGVIARGIGFLSKETTFQVAPIRYPQWLTDQWYEQFCRDIENFKVQWYINDYNQNFGESCAHYYGCEYKPLCLRPNPEEWVNSLYKVDVWNPLASEHYPTTDYILEAMLG